MERVISQFEQIHPDITVQVEPESPAKYVTQIAAGAGPDIMEVPYGAFASMAQSGALLNLNSFIKGDPQVDPNDIFPPAWAAVTYNGIRYGMPFDLSAVWTAFVPKHFTAAGVQDPIAAYKDMTTSGLG